MKLDKIAIDRLVKNFYNRVQDDKILGHIFNDVAKTDWDEHIPILCQFWNSIMLGTKEYSGNAMLKHILLAEKYPLTVEHFDHWLKLFSEEANATLYEADAKIIITRASLIAESIKRRVIK